MRRDFKLTGLLCLVIWAAGCDTGGGADPAVDSQSHWLEGCQADEDCGAAACVCGVCTLPCERDEACATLGASALCAAPGSEAVDGLCAGQAAASVCLPGCQQDADCLPVADGLRCQAGLCVPSGDQACALPEASGQVTLAPTAADNLQPALAQAPQGWAAAWVDGQQGSAEVALGRLDAQGQDSAAWRLTDWPSQASAPSLAVDPTRNRALVAWVAAEGEQTWVQTSLRGLEGGALLAQAPLTAGEASVQGPSVVRLEDGWAVAWLRSDAGASWVRLARLDEQGAALGDPVDLTDPQGDVRQHALIAAEGGLALAWVDQVAGDVRLGLFDALGAPLSEPVVVSSAEADADHLSLAWNQASGQQARYALAWEDRRLDQESPRLYLAQVDGAGAPLDAERAVTDQGKASQHPSLGWSGQSWLLHWADQVAVRQPPGVFAQPFDPQGLEPGQSVYLAQTDGQSLGLASAWGEDRAGVLWSARSPLAAEEETHQIHFLPQDTQGVPSAQEVTLTPALPAQVQRPALATGEQGAALVWRDHRRADPDSAGALYLATMDLEPALAQAPARLTQPGQSAPGGFSLASGQEGYGLLWTDAAQSQLYLTRLSAQGAALGDPATFADQSQGVSWPKLLWDGDTDTWELIWWQGQGGGAGLYHQRASQDGQPLGAPALIASQAPSLGPEVASTSQGLLVAWLDQGRQVTALALDAQRQPLGQAQVYGEGGAVALASNADQALLAWTTEEGVQVIVLDARGQAVGPARPLQVPGAAPLSGFGSLLVLPHGEGWQVAWRGQGQVLMTARLDGQGEVVEYGAGVSLPEGVLLAPWAQGAAWVDAELGAPRLQVLPLACP